MTSKNPGNRENALTHASGGIVAYIQKQRGKYRARFSDGLGNVQSRTFARKADAERLLRQIAGDKLRCQWVDPRNADTPLAAWAEEFLSLCRRLSPTTQETYRRDLDKYVLARFGAYRLGQLPADEIENWLNDEVVAGIAPSPFIATTGPFAACCRSPFRSRRSSPTRVTAWTRRESPSAR